MKWYSVIFVFGVLLGAFNVVYQIFKMTELDAKSRGFKHPKLWGLFATGGQNAGGLIMYLIGRRNYSSTMTVEEKQIIEGRKKKIGVALSFIVVATIGLILTTVL